MKRQILIGAGILFCLAGVVYANQPAYKPGVVLVRFADVNGQSPTKPAKLNVLNNVLQSTTADVKKEYQLVRGLTLVELPAGTTVENAVDALKQSSSVLYAEPDYIYRISAIPNDPMFNQLWGMRNTGQTGGKINADIGAVEAWDISTGSSSIIVAVTDTGVDYNHPDLVANKWQNPGEIPDNDIDDDDNGYIDDVNGYDFINGDNDPCDDNGHGTHVSGTIGAVGDNGIGVAGVCWNVRIMALKFLDADGSGDTADAIEAIEYAVSNGADVINASWGSHEYSAPLYDAIAAAKNAGVIFVAAAGNENFNNDINLPGIISPGYPASYTLENIISVLATTDVDKRASFSNYGLIAVDLGAPGEGILSTLPSSDYGYNDGTSMAAPHVAGACALLLSIDPSLSYRDVKDILLATVDLTLPGLCASNGRLNLLAAAVEAWVDTTAPTMEGWEMIPTATGLRTVSMEAKISYDRSGVEYYFECLNNGQNSGWQISSLYSFSNLSPASTYDFRFKVRDRSTNQNESSWSTTLAATTATGTDTLPPATGDGWQQRPKVVRQGSNYVILMQAKGVDESAPVQFRFRKTRPSSEVFSWQTSSAFSYSSGLVEGQTYGFQCEAQDANGNISDLSVEATVYMSTTGAPGPAPVVRSVPDPYPTIQSAIDASSDGDIVEISPGTYTGPGNWDIRFKRKKITVRSIDPGNPDVVASTIVDCNETIVIGDITFRVQHRGFIFNDSETRESILEGLTITNGIIAGISGAPGAPGNGADDFRNGQPGSTGGDGLDGTGAGIQIGIIPDPMITTANNPSSPTIRNCIITNCIVFGGDGGRGGDGADGDDGDEAVASGKGGDGGDGGNGGNGSGAGIYVSTFSNPLIQNCKVSACFALAGEGGDGGNGGQGGDGAIGANPVLDGCGGNGGNGGDGSGAFGGGIFVDKNSNAIVIGCKFLNSYAAVAGAQAGIGGQVGLPGDNGPPGLVCTGVPGRDGQTAMAVGGGAYYQVNQSGSIVNISASDFAENYAETNGGGIGFSPSDSSAVVISDCNIIGNIADINTGGGIYYEGGAGTLTLTKCTVADNAAGKNGGGLGAGRIYPLPPRFADITVIESYFAGNGADEGGAFYLNNADLTVEDSRLEENTSNEGGAINGFLSGFDLSNSVVIGNYASEPSGLGGGFALWNCWGNVTNCLLKDNTADNFGGAVFLDGWTDEPLAFKNCLITDNSAYYEGGALSCNLGASAQLLNCTVVGNKVFSVVKGAGGGISCAEDDAYVELFNTIIWGNSAYSNRGPQIAIGAVSGVPSFANVYVWYSDVEGGPWDAYIQDPAYTIFWWLDGSFYDDPMFISPDIYETAYYLSQIDAGQVADSPCLDAGNDTAANLSLDGLTTRTDQAGDQGIVDVGYHYPIGAQVPQYLLTIEVVDEAGGRLIAQGGGSDPFTIEAPNSRYVSAGAVVSLQALADVGFRVLSWLGTDDDASTDANNTVTMNADKVVRVAFHQFQLTIVAEKTGGFPPDGNLTAIGDAEDPFVITARNDPVTRGVTPGTVVELYATADPSFKVMSWSGTDDDTSTEPNNTVTMDSDKLVVVAFEPDGFYYLSVTVIGNGTVSPSGRTLQRPGDTITITAAPANPADAIIWTGTDDDNSEESQNTVEMDGHRAVTVKFYRPRILNVGASSAYPTIQAAIDDAQDRDIVQIMPSPQPYFTQMGFEIYGRNITITSVDPYDPAVVAATVITPAEGTEQNVNTAFRFLGVGPLTRLQGITIRGFSAGGLTMVDPEDPSFDGLHGTETIAMGIRFADASPTIINCVLDDCHTFGQNGSNGRGGDEERPVGGHGGWPGGAWGGAVYVGDFYFDGQNFYFGPSNPTFINCTFSNNSAEGGDGGDGGQGAGEPQCGIGGLAGGWYYGPNEITWPREFEPGGLPKDHSGLGGAVYISSNCAPSFEKCSFINNFSSGGLNGIYGQSGCPPNFRREPSARFRIDNLGGAVYMQAGSAAKFSDCLFADNTADPCKTPAVSDGFVSFGGALAVEDGATATLQDCSFVRNLSDVGGGIFSSRSGLNIADSNVSSNRAIHGAGLLVNGGETHVAKSVFAGNDANVPGSTGAGIAIFGAGADINDTVIADNNSMGQAGGIYASGRLFDGGEPDEDNTVLIKNCLITKNRATLGGGGIAAVWHSDPNIVNCTITGNRAPSGRGGGLYAAYGNYTNIVNSIIWGNSAIIGKEITVGITESPSLVDVFYSDVNQTTGSLAIDPGCALNLNAGVINANPRFVNADANDYHLSQTEAGQSQTSPCVDSGAAGANAFGMSTYTTRTDNIPDIEIVDMGYHYILPEGCLLFDFTGDGVVTFGDFAQLARYWLDEDPTLAYNLYDLGEFAGCWLFDIRPSPQDDTTPPQPNPMQWQIEPAVASPTSISMVAALAADNSGGQVQYQFEETTGNPGADDSAWQTNPMYTDIGLQPDYQYCYRVRAKDDSNNATGWSNTVCVTGIGGADVNAPTPPVMIMGPNTVSADVNTGSGQFQWAADWDWWHKIVVDVSTVTDDSAAPTEIEVKFVCIDDSSLNSDAKIPAVQRPIYIGTPVSGGGKAAGWRLTYEGNNIVYDVYVNQGFGLGRELNWRVCVSDPTGNQSCSERHTIGPLGLP